MSKIKPTEIGVSMQTTSRPVIRIDVGTDAIIQDPTNLLVTPTPDMHSLLLDTCTECRTRDAAITCEIQPPAAENILSQLLRADETEVLSTKSAEVRTANQTKQTQVATTTNMEHSSLLPSSQNYLTTSEIRKNF